MFVSYVDAAFLGILVQRYSLGCLHVMGAFSLRLSCFIKKKWNDMGYIVSATGSLFWGADLICLDRQVEPQRVVRGTGLWAAYS